MIIGEGRGGPAGADLKPARTYPPAAIDPDIDISNMYIIRGG